MTNFILIHGAWHGEWCWKKIIPALRKKDCKVITPTLTGLGKESHRLTAETNFTTHVNDVLEILRNKNLHDVILVGHSYAGNIISKVAETEPSRISRLVYLDSTLLDNGESVASRIPYIISKAQAISLPAGKVKVIPPPLPEFLGIQNKEDISWAKSLLTPMPLACLEEKLYINIRSISHIEQVYVLATIPLSPESHKAHIASSSKIKAEGGECYTINGSHELMITNPQEITRLLLKYT